jgi:hypothetical protein
MVSNYYRDKLLWFLQNINERILMRIKVSAESCAYDLCPAVACRAWMLLDKSWRFLAATQHRNLPQLLCGRRMIKIRVVA